MERYVKLDDIWKKCQSSPHHLTLDDAVRLPHYDMDSWDVGKLRHLVERMVSVVVVHGQSDPQFKLGDTIKYSPSEIKKILMAHLDEMAEEVESPWGSF